MPAQTQGLGWRMKEDPRKADHPLRVAAPVQRRNVHLLMPGFPLDQGQTGTCVGHGGKHWELTAPVRRTGRMGPPTAVDMYLAATKRDAWHNGQPDTSLQDGTSITALMLALRDEFGLISSFEWTDDVDKIIDHICSDDGNPPVLGVPWLRSMFETTPEGFVIFDWSSGWAGGHCIEMDLHSETRGHAGGPNSWGRPIDFGKINPKTGLSDGRWRIDYDQLRRLLAEGGDACIARELPRSA
jgi:hypothetical protein